MLNWSLTFLVVAIIASMLGLGGVTSSAASFSHIMLAIFVVLFFTHIVLSWRPTR